MASTVPRLSVADAESLYADVFSCPDDQLQATFAKWFSPEYVQVTDGHTSTFAEFVQHITKLRSLVRTIDVRVLYLVQEGTRLADRHVVTVEKHDGSKSVLEVILLAERDPADGRMLRVWETSRTVEGATGSEELARVR